MTPERWAKIEELFHRAAVCEPESRIALLDRTCSGDPELRREVEALLVCEGSASSFLRAAMRSEVDSFAFSLAGSTVSHYRILDGLGGGGMGVVYRAEDVKLGRLVAIKFLPEESANSDVALSRFEREARSASALENSNICPVYEFGEHEGRPFLVMQLLEGQTLRELLERNSEESEARKSGPGRMPLPIEQVLDFSIQIATGLEAAHRKGIIHRDIKPGNIFVTREGQVKILDFGLAKLAREVAAAGDARSDSSVVPHEAGAALNPFISRTGVAIGTAAYMSPEQVRGETLDVRTDLFSFGLVMYEMSTGLHAFTGDTGPQLHEAILNATPTQIGKANPGIPTKLERIVAKAIEKEREARYQNASEIRADLETLKRKLNTTRLRRRVAAAAGIIALLVAGGFLWLARRGPSVAQVMPEIKFRQLTTNSPDNPVTSGSISPSGEYLAYVDSLGIHVKNIKTGATQGITPPEEIKNEIGYWQIVSAAWLPDNIRFIANGHPTNEEPRTWSSQTSIWMFSRLGDTPYKLRDHATAGSVSPDGHLISFGANIGNFGVRELWLMQPDGGQAHRLFDSDENSAIIPPLWSPNSQRGLFTRTDASGDTVFSRDLRAGASIAIMAPSEMKQTRGDAAWLPDGRLIYQAVDPESTTVPGQETCNFWSMRLDPLSGKRIGKPSRLTNWTGFCISSANATTDGKRLAFLALSGGHVTVYMADLKAGGTRVFNQRHLSLDENDDYGTDWIGNNAVLVDRSVGDHYELYRQPLTGDLPEAIVSAPPGGVAENAIVTPDRRWVIAQVWPLSDNSSRVVPIVRIPIAGGAPEEIFRVHEGSLISCAKMPSGFCTVAEQSDDKKQMIITAFDAVKGRGHELARFDIDPTMDLSYYLQGRISPDGTRLLALTSPKGPIQVRSLHGGSNLIVDPKGADDVLSVRWTADGSGFYLINRTKQGSQLLHSDLQGNTKLLRSCRLGSLRQVCDGVPSPDGVHFAIDLMQLGANMWMMENF